MKAVSDLIRQADPFRYEPAWSPHVRLGVRQKVLQAVADEMPSVSIFRRRMAVAAVTLWVVVAAAAVLIPRVWAPSVQAQASVRFEIRLAERLPGPGLLSMTGAEG